MPCSPVAEIRNLWLTVSAVCRLLSAFCCVLSAIRYLLPVAD